MDDDNAHLRAGLASIEARLSAVEGRRAAPRQPVADINATIMLTGLAVLVVIVVALDVQAWYITASTPEIVRSTVAEYIRQHPAPEAK